MRDWPTRPPWPIEHSARPNWSRPEQHALRDDLECFFFAFEQREQDDSRGDDRTRLESAAGPEIAMELHVKGIQQYQRH